MYKDIAKYSNFKSKIYRIEYIEYRVQCIIKIFSLLNANLKLNKSFMKIQERSEG